MFSFRHLFGYLSRNIYTSLTSRRPSLGVSRLTKNSLNEHTRGLPLTMRSGVKSKSESRYESPKNVEKSKVIMKNYAKTYLLFLCKFIAAVFFALVIWELVLSNIYLSKPLSHTHPDLGRIYSAGRYIQGREGFARTTLNALGLRNAPIGAKQPGKTRILILGDSYTQASQVSDKEMFSSILQKRLGTNYEIINSGREGASPNLYIALARFNNHMFQQDMTVIQLSEQDLTIDPFATDQDFYFVKTQNGYAIHKNKSFISSNALATHFAYLQKVLNFSTARLSMEKLESLGSSSNVTASVSIADQASLIPFIVKKLKASYAHPMVVYIPKIDYFAKDYDHASVTEILLTKAALEADVDFISMRDDYIQVFKNEHKVSHGFANSQPGMGHINALGHLLIANTLTKMIQTTEATQ
jgi:hypothetical protein